MALGDGEGLRFWCDEVEGFDVACDEVCGDVWKSGELGEPVGARVDDVYMAGQGGEYGGECLNYVAGAEDGDVPGGCWLVDFEKEGHFAAAGHADVALEVPCLEVGERVFFR